MLYFKIFSVKIVKLNYPNMQNSSILEQDVISALQVDANSGKLSPSGTPEESDA